MNLLKMTAGSSAPGASLRTISYDPAVSRFLNRDPIGSAGGLNLYRYGGNSPVMNLDPSGIFSARDAWNWYMGGFSDWTDRNLMGGSTANLGEVTGEYDSGCASGWDVALTTLMAYTDISKSAR